MSETMTVDSGDVGSVETLLKGHVSPDEVAVQTQDHGEVAKGHEFVHQATSKVWRIMTDDGSVYGLLSEKGERDLVDRVSFRHELGMGIWVPRATWEKRRREADGVTEPGTEYPGTGVPAMTHMPERMLSFFDDGRKTPVAVTYGMLAQLIAVTVAPGPERQVALRKLVESRDAAMRAEARPGI